MLRSLEMILKLKMLHALATVTGWMKVKKRTQYLRACMYPFSKEPTAFSDGSFLAENRRHTFSVIPVNCLMGQLLKESCFSLKDLQSDMKFKILPSSRVVIWFLPHLWHHCEPSRASPSLLPPCGKAKSQKWTKTPVAPQWHSNLFISSSGAFSVFILCHTCSLYISFYLSFFLLCACSLFSYPCVICLVLSMWILWSLHFFSKLNPEWLFFLNLFE